MNKLIERIKKEYKIENNFYFSTSFYLPEKLDNNKYLITPNVNVEDKNKKNTICEDIEEAYNEGLAMLEYRKTNLNNPNVFEVYPGFIEDFKKNINTYGELIKAINKFYITMIPKTSQNQCFVILNKTKTTIDGGYMMEPKEFKTLYINPGDEPNTQPYFKEIKL